MTKKNLIFLSLLLMGIGASAQAACPSTSTVLDWSTAWGAPDAPTDRTLTTGTFSQDLTFSGDTGDFDNNRPDISGGDLRNSVNFSANGNSITMSYTFTPAIDDLSFLVRDIDASNGTPPNWGDRITITASMEGINVPVTITPVTAGQLAISANTVDGTSALSSTNTLGHAIFSFASPIDQLTYLYSHPPAVTTANPGGQFTFIDDFVGCAAQTDLSITKTDSTTTYVPGTNSTYTIVVTNNGYSDSYGADIADTLPVGVTLSAPVTCSASGSAICGAASIGVIGDTSFTDNNPVIPVGDTLTYTVPVSYSANMADY